MRVCPRQHDGARKRQSLRLIELITCVMSSYSQPESSFNRLPSPLHCQLWYSRATCTGCTLAPVVAQRRACRQPPRAAPVPWNLQSSAQVALCVLPLHSRYVPHSGDELNLRHNTRSKSVDCRNLSLKSTGTSITGISTVFCTVAPREHQSRTNNWNVHTLSMNKKTSTAKHLPLWPTGMSSCRR